jgi:hypothetical protein
VSFLPYCPWIVLAVLLTQGCGQSENISHEVRPAKEKASGLVLSPRERFARDARRLQSEPRAEKTEAADLRGSFQQGTVAALDEDGKLRVQCAPGAAPSETGKGPGASFE